MLLLKLLLRHMSIFLHVSICKIIHHVDAQQFEDRSSKFFL